MIESDGGRSNKLYLTACQQGTVAASTCTGNQCISIFYDFRSNFFSRQINHFIGERFDSFLYIRYFIVNDNFHTCFF